MRCASDFRKFLPISLLFLKHSFALNHILLLECKWAFQIEEIIYIEEALNI